MTHTCVSSRYFDPVSATCFHFLPLKYWGKKHCFALRLPDDVSRKLLLNRKCECYEALNVNQLGVFDANLAQLVKVAMKPSRWSLSICVGTSVASRNRLLGVCRRNYARARYLPAGRYVA